MAEVPSQWFVNRTDLACGSTVGPLVAAQLGVRAVDVRKVIRDGRRLFYDRDGTRTRIARIYNRVIPDDVERANLTLPFDYRDDLDVEWTAGPDWFYRVSKFSIPHLSHPWIPRTMYLDDVGKLPADRENWLLKPLFSYAGGGIVFAPTDQQIAAIPAAFEPLLQEYAHNPAPSSERGLI